MPVSRRRVRVALVSAFTTALVVSPGTVARAADGQIATVSPPAMPNGGVASVAFTTSRPYVAQATSVTITGPAGAIAGTVAQANATTVTATFDLALAAPGAYSARIHDAVSDDTCAAGCFTVTANQPTARSVAPGRVGVGAAGVPLAVTGAEFARGATVAVYRDGLPDPWVTFAGTGVTATQLTGTVAVAEDAPPGGRDVRVTNTDGQRDVCTGCLTVTAPPRLGTVAPDAAGQGAVGRAVTVTGFDFVPGMTATFPRAGSADLAGVSVTGIEVTGATAATLVLTVANDAATGARDLVLTNPDGGATRHDAAFSVTAAPRVAALTPARLGGGADHEPVDVAGAGLGSGTAYAVVPPDGVVVHGATASDPSSARLVVSVLADAVPGTRDVRVTNPDGGTSVTTGALTVVAAPAVAVVDPPSLGRGASGKQVTITGTGFDPAGVDVSIAGVTLTDVTRVDATTITAHASVGPTVTPGPRAVSVVGRADRGRSTCDACFAVDSFSLDGVTPGSAPNAGSHAVRVVGSTLPPDAALTGTLVRVPALAGQDPIVATGFVDGGGTSFTATFDLTDAAPGRYRALVSGPAGAGTCTCFLDVTPNAPPNVVAATPASAPQGATGRVVTIRGSGFTHATDVTFGTGVAKAGGVTFVDSTRLTVPVDVDPAAPVGPVATTVGVPGADAPVTTTCGDCFAVAARPVVSSLDVTTRGQGAAPRTVTVTGTGFRPGVVASVSGDGITVSDPAYASPQSMTFTVAVAATVTPGARTVTVANTDDGTGTCDCFAITPAPAPAVVAPGAAGVGEGDVAVTVTGTSFQPGATISAGDDVAVSGVARPSEERLDATFDLSAATVGPHAVTVLNPDGGTATCACTFVVDAVPAVTTVAPDRRGAGAIDQTLRVNGTDFSAAAVPAFDDPLVSVQRWTVVDATAIDVVVEIDPDAESAPRTVSVRNTDTGQSGSCACFLVTPGPSPVQVTPSGRSVGSGTVAVDLYGTAFAGSTVDFGLGITVSDLVVTATHMTARLTIGADAPTGVRTVTVVNTDGGRGTCACFGVTPRPVVTGVDAPALPRGADLRVRLDGSDFRTGAAVSFGDGITVSEVVRESAYAVTARLTIAPDAALGPRDVALDNGDGGTTTCPGCFRVISTPKVTKLDPKVRGRGAAPVAVTVTGTGFDEGARISVPADIGLTAGPTTYVDATTLRFDLGVASNAPLGAQPVTVTNGDGGTQTCAACFEVTPAPYVTSVNPNVVQRNRTGITATLTGGNFTRGPLHVELGDGVTVTDATATSDTSATVTFDVDGFASIDRHPVTVRNPDGGTGTCAVCFVVSSPRVFTVELAPAPVSGEAQTFTVTAHVNSNPSSPADPTYTGTPAVAVAGDDHATAGSCTVATDGVSTCGGYVFGDLGPLLVSVAGTGADTDLGGSTHAVVQPTGLEYSPAPPRTGGLGQLVTFTVRPTVGVTGASIERYAATRSLVIDGEGANPPTGSVIGCSVATCTFATVFTIGGLKSVQVVDTSQPSRATPVASVLVPYPTKLTIAAKPATAAGGKTATVSGRLTTTREGGMGLTTEPVRIYARVYPSATYKLVRTATTWSDGTWHATFTMTAHTVFTAVYPGSTSYQKSASAKVLVAVTTTVTRRSPGTGTSLRYGLALVVTGTTTPRQPGSLAYLVERYPNGRLALLAKVRIAADGTFRLTRNGLARGWHTFYVQVAGTCCTSGGVSPRFTVRVT